MSRINAGQPQPDGLQKYRNDYTYFNVIINNNTTQAKLASYIEQRDAAIITDMENYYMSVDRFRVNTGTIPIFLFPKGDVFSIGFRRIDNGAFASPPVVVQYEEQIVGTYHPSQGSNPIYHYDQFLDMIKFALEDHVATLPLELNPPPDFQVFIVVDETIDKLEIVFKSSDEDKLVAFLDRVSLSVSPQLYRPFLSGFNGILDPSGYYNIPLSIRPLPHFAGSPTNPGRYNRAGDPQFVYTVPATYNNLPNWHSLRRIIFTTGSLPINSEQIATSIDGQTGRPVTLQIITDFEAPRDPSGSLDNNLYYFNEQGRRINIIGNGVLSKFDVKVFYQDKDLNLYPLYIAPGESLEMKIAFKRRKNYEHQQY